MKILWFANTPCGAAQKLGLDLNIGGWLSALESQLSVLPGVELNVAFYWGEDIPPFHFNQTTYYPVFKSGSGSKFGRLVNRMIRKEDDQADLASLVRVVEQVKPDLVHVHGTENNFGLVQEMINVPVVVSIQGILTVYLEKYFSGVPYATARKYEGLPPRMLMKSVLYKYRNFRNAAVREKKIIASSKYILGRTGWDRKVTGLLAPNRMYFKGDEILRDQFYNNDWDKKEFGETVQLVTVMSDGIYKGLEMVVKTARLLIENNSMKFKWVIIGQNTSQDMPKLISSWLKADFAQLQVSLVGSKNQSDLIGILKESDIFCQVSHIENSPNSLCEAMLLGLPIVASYAGGTDTLLEGGQCGVLVQDGDPFSLAASVIELSRDFARAKKLGDTARESASVRHDRTRITADLSSTYKTIIEISKQHK